MFTKRALLAGMAATGFSLAAARPASAQTYPTRPVKMVVPLPAGSAPDVRHRLIAQALTQLWGHQVIVENRPGGGGIIGTRAVLGEQPDGYTLLAALASIYMILPAQQENLPFDVNRDMIPIGLTAYEGLVMACSPKLGVNSLAEFIALAKKMPDKLVIGTNPAGQPAAHHGETVCRSDEHWHHRRALLDRRHRRCDPRYPRWTRPCGDRWMGELARRH